MLDTYAAQMIAAIRISFADRTNFVLQMAGMAVNNGFFFLLWVLFFAGFRSVGGWQFADVSLLLGIIMIVVGIAGVFFGGYRDMAAAILRGEPDALLTQPKAVLPRLLAGESLALPPPRTGFQGDSSHPRRRAEPSPDTVVVNGLTEQAPDVL